MERAALVWHPSSAETHLAEHPTDPRRHTLTLSLAEELGVLPHLHRIEPRPATIAELALVHDRGYIDAVYEASDWSGTAPAGAGLGTDDTPIYPGMHDAAALLCGGTLRALAEVLAGPRTRAFALAGGMHHAHRVRAAGFCVYNDAAVAIAAAREADPSLRVLYVDIDAHHGDGVQEAFYSSADVMTISMHQSGFAAFPGTGFAFETGTGTGEGFSANVPLPPGATDACFALGFAEVVEPLARRFAPDVIVAQVGCDTLHADPLADLNLTLPGYRHLVGRIIALAGELCDGRLVALGGGGYDLEAAPRAWTSVAAELAGLDLPPMLDAPDPLTIPPAEEARLLAQTAESIAEVRSAMLPFHAL